MTIEELKSEAKKLGYKLIKDSRPPKLLHCKCGCNRRRQLWNCAEQTIILECNKCGFRAEGKNRSDAIIAWNLLVKDGDNGSVQM